MSIAVRSVLFSMASASMMLTAAFSNNVSVGAADVASQKPDPTVIALEIVPVCSSQSLSQAVWKVTNKNAAPVHIDWNNAQNNFSGGYDAAPGVSELRTGYAANDPNNTTKFAYSGNVSQTNATAEACKDETPAPATCIDGRIQQNLVINWVNDNTVSVTSRDHLPLCDDVTIYFSSYTMPDNYNGQAFEGNVTAYPQPVFDSVRATLAKGTDGNTKLSVALPNQCKNIQVDVYYAPEITTVGPNGHGTHNIESRVYRAKGVCEAPAVQPNGNNNASQTTVESSTSTIVTRVESTTIVSTSTESISTSVRRVAGRGGASAAPLAMVTKPKAMLPASLPNTGSTPSMLLPLIAAMVTYGSVYIFGRRRA